MVARLSNAGREMMQRPFLARSCHLLDVRFGHKAAPQHTIRSTSALGCKADLKNAENPDFEGPVSADSVEKLLLIIHR